MVDFQLDDCTLTIDEETQKLIAELILAWARYDSLVTHWTFRSFGMGPDEGPILLGNMDTKTKIERLKKLHNHLSIEPAATWIGYLHKTHETHVEVRNAICHKSCAGHHRRAPNYLIFHIAKPPIKMIGHMTVEMYHLDQIKAAITFAKEAADKISDIVKKLEELREQPLAQSPAEGG